MGPGLAQEPSPAAQPCTRLTSLPDGAQGPQPGPLSPGHWAAGAELCGPASASPHSPPSTPVSPATRCLGGLSGPSSQATVGSASGPERGLDCRSCFGKQLGLPPNCRGGNRKSATGLSFASEKARVGSSSQVSFQRRLKTIRSFRLSAAFPGWKWRL